MFIVVSITALMMVFAFIGAPAYAAVLLGCGLSERRSAGRAKAFLIWSACISGATCIVFLLLSGWKLANSERSRISDYLVFLVPVVINLLIGVASIISLTRRAQSASSTKGSPLASDDDKQNDP
jgi:hypothetical protein